MKLVLICSGGLSTTWIVRKIKEYAAANEPDLELANYGLADYDPQAKAADVILLGPQIGYYQKEIEEKTGRPVGVISSSDYATANCQKILEQAKSLAAEK